MLKKFKENKKNPSAAISYVLESLPLKIPTIGSAKTSAITRITIEDTVMKYMQIL